MYNYDKELVAILSNILPTYYELNLTKDIEKPCISWMLHSNTVNVEGDTLGYSYLNYQIKVWSNDVKDLNEKSELIDETLRPIGFKRMSCIDMFEVEGNLKQRVMTYQANVKELF